MVDRVPTHVITGVNTKKGLEVSFVPSASNHLAKVILRKSADGEQGEMSMLKQVALQKALAAGGAPAAYIEQIEKDADLEAFLAKGADDQKTEVTAWVTKSGWKAEGEPIAKDKTDPAADDGDADDMAGKIKKAIAEAIAPIAAENAELKKSVAAITDNTSIAALEKRAATEFKGLPLEVSKTAQVLKSIATLDAEVVSSIETVFKAHAELASLVGPSMGLATLQKDEASASARLHKAASEKSEKDGVPFEKAYADLCAADPALAAQVDAEEARYRAN